MFLKDVEGGGSSARGFYCLSGSCFLGPSGLVFSHGKYQSVGVWFMYPPPQLIVVSWFPLWLRWEDLPFTSCFSEWCSNPCLFSGYSCCTPISLISSQSLHASPSDFYLLVSCPAQQAHLPVVGIAKLLSAPWAVRLNSEKETHMLGLMFGPCYFFPT